MGDKVIFYFFLLAKDIIKAVICLGITHGSLALRITSDSCFVVSGRLKIRKITAVFSGCGGTNLFDETSCTSTSI
jgi:hypothetical protein